MNYVEARAAVLDVLQDQSDEGYLTIRGLQNAYRVADASAKDTALPAATRAAATWLRDQADAELTVRELDPMVYVG
jgi:hypothetical protein